MSRKDQNNDRSQVGHRTAPAGAVVSMRVQETMQVAIAEIAAAMQDVCLSWPCRRDADDVGDERGV